MRVDAGVVSLKDCASHSRCQALPSHTCLGALFAYPAMQSMTRSGVVSFAVCVQDGLECTFSPKTEEHSRAILAASTSSDRLQQSSSEQVSTYLIACPSFGSHTYWQ